MQSYPNLKIFSWFLSAFSESTSNLEYLERKDEPREVICFWNYRLQKAGLLKCIKSPVSEHLWTVNMLKCPKDCLSLHGSIFLIFLITLKENQLHKFCFSSVCNLETVCYHINTRWQAFCLSKPECLSQPIQMQISPNHKIFSEFFSAFSQSTLNFGILWKKWWASEVVCFWNYRLQKAWFLKSPKNPCQNTYWQSTC